MTRCKEGDIAIYRGLHKEHHGKIVKVGRQVAVTKPDGNKYPVSGVFWEIDPPLMVEGTLRFKCADSSLTPLRDPGDDAVDETLLRLPAPSTERETA